MAKANAKMELRDTVTEADVDNSIALFLEAFISTVPMSRGPALRRKFEAYTRNARQR
ncbi:hypothetical protein Pmar_PMAR004409, partial [Perkinsus marinus ATCC 50983]